MEATDIAALYVEGAPTVAESGFSVLLVLPFSEPKPLPKSLEAATIREIPASSILLYTPFLYSLSGALS